MTANVSPLAQNLDKLLQFSLEAPQNLKVRLQEVLRLYKAISLATPTDLESALKELHVRNVDIKFHDATRTLLNLKEKLNFAIDARIDWDPLRAVLKKDEPRAASGSKEAPIGSHANTVELSWGPVEVMASAWIVKKYLEILAQSGITVSPEKIKEWLKLVTSDTEIVRLPTREFELAIRQAVRDEARAKLFEKNPPELTPRMKKFLGTVRELLGVPQLAGFVSAHAINDLHLDGSTVTDRVKNLLEKHTEAMKSATSESLACLLLGKILGYEWELNVNNAEIRLILAQARYELKQNRLDDDQIAKFDHLLVASGISKAALLSEFGLKT